MATYVVRFEGPGVLALDVVTRLADAEGVDLVASATPEPVGAGAVTLEVTVEGSDAAVFGAVGSIDALLPDGAAVAVSPSAPSGT